MNVEPSRVVHSGTFEEINELFYSRSWSDGLPIAPPTPQRVSEFVDASGLDPDAIVGSLVLPSNSFATARTVAVNAVMAGCRPEYMPVLLAIVEAVTAPEFRLQDAGSTPGWEPLIILNGPIIKELDFNCEAGVMRVGRRANTSVGRFLRLFMRNVAGLLVPPGSTDKATFGQNFNVVLAESEPALTEIGWPSFSADRGYASGQNVVTVQSVVAVSMPTYSAGETKSEHASMLVDVIGRGVWGYWAWAGLWFGKFYPLLALSPSIARVIAADGGSKDWLRNYFAEHVQLSVSQLERYAWAVGITDFNVSRMVDSGRLPPGFGTGTPEDLVRVLLNPEDIGIVVSGDPERNQSKGFVQNHVQGPPVSRVIEF